jgi:hypothetical protein
MTAPVQCPRCGRRSAPTGGPYCPHCGQHIVPLRWVAEPPPSAARRTPPTFRVPYTGAPRYRFIPRWGFPVLPWTPPEPEERKVDPLHAARSLVGTAVPLLWACSAVALIASGAEAWRYVLLLDSRDGALSAGAVAASDALVTAAGTVAPIIAAIAGILVVLWSLRSSQAAAEQAGVQPSRSRIGVVLGWLVPGANLTVPGSLLAEIEHTALGRPRDQRPHPSRLVAAWWALWAIGCALAAVTLLLSLRTGIQARADGVVLHAVVDLVAAATAAVTAVLLVRLTRLLGPPRVVPRELVVAVNT